MERMKDLKKIIIFSSVLLAAGTYNKNNAMGPSIPRMSIPTQQQDIGPGNPATDEFKKSVVANLVRFELALGVLNVPPEKLKAYLQKTQTFLRENSTPENQIPQNEKDLIVLGMSLATLLETSKMTPEQQGEMMLAEAIKKLPQQDKEKLQEIEGKFREALEKYKSAKGPEQAIEKAKKEWHKKDGTVEQEPHRKSLILGVYEALKNIRNAESRTKHRITFERSKVLMETEKFKKLIKNKDAEDPFSQAEEAMSGQITQEESQ